MRVETLLDTNVLLYALSTVLSERAKRDRARNLLASTSVGFIAQVSAAFFDNATRKRPPRLTHKEAVAILAPLRVLPL